jgi:hypothetical protein
MNDELKSFMATLEVCEPNLLTERLAQRRRDGVILENFLAALAHVAASVGTTQSPNAAPKPVVDGSKVVVSSLDSCPSRACSPRSTLHE